MAGKCWIKGAMTDLRLLQGAGWKSSYGIGLLFGKGHMALRNGAAVYVARCKDAEVELQNQTRCIHESPVTFEGREGFVTLSAWCCGLWRLPWIVRKEHFPDGRW
jgi:hypothetical protein